MSFDFSNAVEANYENNFGKGDLFIFQGDLYNLPLDNNAFDFVFCYGVIQHTPDPFKAYQVIFSKCKPGGKISIDCYRKPMNVPKKVWRPITSKMDPIKLYKIIRFYIPIYLPIDTILKKTLRTIPIINRFNLGLKIPIPCWNYFDYKLDWKQRIEWAIMDTFDALGAAYDQPMTLSEVKEMIKSSQNKTVEVFYGSNGIVANITKN